MNSNKSKHQAYIHDLHHLVHLTIGLYPALYYPIYSRKYPANTFAVTKNTEICIEGFPRCANTYSACAFKLVNRDVKLGHHHHVPAQIFKSVSMGIPTVVVIRNPEDAVASLLVLKNSIKADIYVKAYIKFYNSIMSLLDKVIVADFSQTTGNFNQIIEAVNKKFNTNFNLIDNLENRKEEIYKILNDFNGKFEKRDIKRHYIPNEEKAKFKKEVIKYVKESKLLPEANELYLRIINKYIKN